ncbi:MAG: hypothetical protein LC790_14605 [Actinobacteria bacterium]|nr:hypothetical protein [Actinomycetota bacterium]MCA1700058.1 hypothetical protein [Actinomycetota bacterium]
MATPELRHNPPALIEALGRHQVEYVIVGGLAVAVWGHPRATKDTDIVVPAGDEENDRRLRAAIAELDAQPLSLEGVDVQGPEVRWEIEQGLERWDTSAGILDVLRDPEGAPPYARVRERAVELEAFGARGVYAGREDLIQMKLAAARIQDLLDLDALLDPRNSEPERVELRRRDRELLRTDGEPQELGEAIDPLERELDQLRRALQPSSRRRELERALRARARELQAVSDGELAELDRGEAPPLPPHPAEKAAHVAQAASRIERAESSEMELLRRREELGIVRRRDRRALTEELDQASGRVERLRQTAQEGIEEVRRQIAATEHWWAQHGEQAVDRIAIARERYRRERLEVAERVRRVADEPPGYVTDLLGERPVRAPERDAWETAARSIEAHAARYADPADPTLNMPATGGRAARASWERLQRALAAAGVAPARGPELDDYGPDLGP